MSEFLRIRGHIHHDRPPTFREDVEQVTLSDLSHEAPGKIVVTIEYDESLIPVKEYHAHHHRNP